MKVLGYIVRFAVMGAIMWWYLWRYLWGRLGRFLFIRDREKRKRSVAHQRGVILRVMFARLGACFVKLGQVLSTRPDLLAPEIIDELRRLQDRMPPFAFAKARRIIEEDLGGRLEDHFRELDEQPVAAASVAQVHRGHAKDGTEVAVKVLRPDVRHKVKRDAAILIFMSRIVAWNPRWRLSDPVGHLRHFTSGILEQTDLRNEAANYTRFRELFADVPGVTFPAVFAPLSSERVMTMSFERGKKIDALGPGDHRELAGRLQRAVLKMCFEDGFFHADLHPGNMLVLDSGDLCLLDVGLVKELSSDVLLQFMDITKCVAMGTAADFVNHLRQFHTYMGGVDWVSLEKDVTDFVVRFRAKSIGQLEIGLLISDLFELARRYKVHPLPDLALVFVGLVTAEGIGKQLHPNNNLFNDTAAYLMPLLAKRGLGLA